MTIKLIFSLFLILLSAFIIGGFWKCFEKAGYAGWKSLIPIYNVYLIIKIAKVPEWLLILFVIPIVNFIAAGYVYFKFSQAFGKSTTYSAISTILFPITIPLIGFDDSDYSE
jgi:hypothetical protein